MTRKSATVWAVTSQGAYAASNVALTLVAAALLGPDDFGELSVALLLYLLVRGPIVAAFGQAAIVDPSALTGRQLCQDAQRRTLRTTAGPAILIFAFGLLMGMPTWQLMLVAAFPVLVTFEVVRTTMLGLGLPAVAARSDAAWLLVQLVGTFALARFQDASVLSIAAPWACGGFIAFAIAATNLRGDDAREASRNWSLTRSLALDELLASGLQRGSMALSALIVGAAAIAQLRLAIVLFNGVLVIGSALLPRLLRTYRNELSGTGSRLWDAWRNYAATMAGLVAFSFVALQALSAGFATQLGSNVTSAATFIAPVAVFRLGGAMTMASSSMMRAGRSLSTNTLLRTRLVDGIATGALSLGFSYYWGITGLAYALAITAIGSASLWLFATRRQYPSRLSAQTLS